MKTSDLNFAKTTQASTSFLGLAPYLRASIAGIDLQPIGQAMLAQAQSAPNDAELWMNLSVAMQCVGQHDIGVSIQSIALEQKRIYTLPATMQPAKLRVLLLLVAGDIAANTPIDCLLENTDVDLIFYYVTPNNPLALPIPEHDVLMLGMSEVDENRSILLALKKSLACWHKPIINAPQYIACTGRNTASVLLQNIPGLLIPPTLRTTHATLSEIAMGKSSMSEQFTDCDFPFIVRPVGSQAGRDLARINRPDELENYLAQVLESDFFISRFIDYSGEDAQFRKYRIALIDGKPYACHMAVSSHWMVHYVNAGMYEEAKKREEELAFFEQFDSFAQHHHLALQTIYQRTQLDYVCIDCAETRSGELLIFEIDHTMVVHAMDSEALFPYKQQHMQKVQDAFRNFLIRLATPRTRANHAAASNPRNDLNFSGGPGALPASVLQQVQQAIIEVPGVGLSILGISHRSDWFASVVSELENNIRTLLNLPKNYHVLFLQGGATQQFSMIPMTLLHGKTAPADYLHTGYWSGKSVAEAQRIGAIRTLWSGAENGFKNLPHDEDLSFSPDAPYLHYISNETVEGLQFHRVLGRDDVPRVCDMSSDFLSQPCEAERFSLIYAHAQKNIGPAGVTVVLMRDELLKDAPNNLPGFLDYRNHINAHSVFNTPPVFSIYVVLLITRWLLNDIGGLTRMAEINRQKASLMYSALDDSHGFYRSRAALADRSLMNVAFTLPTPEIEKRFLAETQAAGFSGLAGHRSVGGIRASLYNGLTVEAVNELVEFMEKFRKHHQS